jgi:hypothetical protein
MDITSKRYMSDVGNRCGFIAQDAGVDAVDSRE